MLCVESKDSVVGTVVLYATVKIREELYHIKDMQRKLDLARCRLVEASS